MSIRSSRVQIALVVVGLLAVAAAGYFFLIAPKRSAAAKLGDEIVATQSEIANRRASSRTTTAPAPKVGVAEIFELTRAMPDEAAVSEAILELNQIARSSGIVLRSIAPQSAVQQTGFRVLPITIVFDGRYSTVTGFLARLRNLVRMDGGKLQARGRLFTVESISLTEGERKFPYVQANATLNTFVFAPGPPAATSGSATTATATTGESS